VLVLMLMLVLVVTLTRPLSDPVFATAVCTRWVSHPGDTVMRPRKTHSCPVVLVAECH